MAQIGTDVLGMYPFTWLSLGHQSSTTTKHQRVEIRSGTNNNTKIWEFRFPCKSSQAIILDVHISFPARTLKEKPSHREIQSSGPPKGFILIKLPDTRWSRYPRQRLLPDLTSEPQLGTLKHPGIWGATPFDITTKIRRRTLNHP
jgi:hypothetical protein